MGFLDRAKDAAKQKAKDVAKTAVLGDTEFVCSHCHRTRSRAQVTSFGSKNKKPRTWTCKDATSCRKAREKNASEGTVRHSRRKHPGELPME